MLIFDIGLHRSGFTKAYLDLADKIIGVEANPHLFAEAEREWQNSDKVIILNRVVSDAGGTIPFYISNTDTLSTSSLDWINNSRFSGQHKWSSPIEVPSITLDELIKIYGVPDLIKLDIEGSEREAVLGLSQKVPELCFEWVEEDRDKIFQTVAHLQSVGFTEFGWIEYDNYLQRPEKFSSWEELGLKELLDENRKTFWGMIFAN